MSAILLVPLVCERLHRYIRGQVVDTTQQLGVYGVRASHAKSASNCCAMYKPSRCIHVENFTLKPSNGCKFTALDDSLHHGLPSCIKRLPMLRCPASSSYRLQCACLIQMSTESTETVPVGIFRQRCLLLMVPQSNLNGVLP